MAAAKSTRSLEQTPTWAVAVVCFVLVLISLILEHVIHIIGKWLKSRHKRALYEALDKIKSELMVLGFISLLLTVLQGSISKICIPNSAGNSWHPCKKKTESGKSDESIGRKLLWNSNSVHGFRRILAAGKDKCAIKGKVPLVDSYGIHQLHIFIFILAVFHVFYSILTMALGRLKMKSWKAWETETKTVEYKFSHDPERFRFARDTSFGRRHLNFWSRSPVLIWIVCFFRQFVRSVTKVDYFTLRHGFIMAHLAPQSATRFDFRKYIKRSLEDDFKVVVGISPIIWLCAVVFLLFNTHGLYSYLWLPFIPLIIILMVGTKLQVIITRMGLKIQDRGDVVKGDPVVQPADNHFWFNRPRLVLHLIHFVLFQNAFQLAFFFWAWYEFGLHSCFHEHTEDIVIRLSMGVLIQILCSYVTLPLYALVTQMGSNMKTAVFDERVATALRKWHHTAKKNLKENRRSGSVTPQSLSRPGTPTLGMSPVHLLRHHRSEFDSPSPRFYNSDNYDRWDTEGSPSPSHHHGAGEGSSSHQQYHPDAEPQLERIIELQEPSVTTGPHFSQPSVGKHPADFSFAKR